MGKEKARLFLGLGLSVPCGSVEFLPMLTGCGRIVKTRKRMVGQFFLKYFVQMEKCRVVAYIRMSGGLCWLTMLFQR